MTAFVTRLRRTFKPWLDPKGYRLEVRELRDGDVARGPHWHVNCLRALHPTPALSYRLNAAGRSLVISGDTGPNPPLAHFAAHCDVLLLEAGLEPGEKVPVHLNAKQAMALARLIAPRQVLFYHLTESSARELTGLLRRRGLRGRVAKDLMRVQIG
jgi:ribonuclease BN (tRNA processing enzyme)